MAGITLCKTCVTLYPLWSFKKTVVGYIEIKQQETYEKLKNRGWYSKYDTDILIMLPLLRIIIMITLLLELLTTNESNNCNNYNNNNVII